MASRIVVVAAYVAFVLVLTWPLPLQLRTHLPGDPAGDTGIYVWNQWVFHYELIERGHLPFYTDRVLAFTGGTDLSLHNYTVAADVLALPFVSALGVVAAFNVTYLLVVLLSALGTFALARRVGLPRFEAWLAGAFFVASPTMLAKGTAHYSLVNAAPLPLFLCALFLTLHTRRIRHAVLVGVTAAWATYADAYFAVFCLLMGVVVVVARLGRLEWHRRPAGWRGLAMVDVSLLVLLGVLGWRLAVGPVTVRVGPAVIGIQTLHNLVMAVVVVAAARALLTWRPAWVGAPIDWREHVRLALCAVAVTIVALSPLLYWIGIRWTDGRLPQNEVLWRSSPRGVDLLGYLVPNPHHPLFGEATRAWFMPPLADAYPEFVASFSLAALLLVVVAASLRRLPRFWVAFTTVFVALSCGPFLYFAGLSTAIPMPWAILRFAPLVGLARSPARFAIIAALGLSVLVAWSFFAIRRTPGPARWLAPLALLLAACELLPVDRPLHAAVVPATYRALADTPGADRSVLELPFGMRDGTFSFGNFSPKTQFHQVFHGKPLVSGYLSRISGKRLREKMNQPILAALSQLSVGDSVSEELARRAREARPAFLARSCLGFVVVEKARTSVPLREFAIATLDLALVAEGPTRQLYVPRNLPPCSRRSDLQAQR